MAVRADYVHDIEHYKDKDFIIIEDLDRGNMSVTNDIEAVVAQIEKDEGINADYYHIIYLDSDRTWTGWSRKGSFIFLTKENAWEAAADRSIHINSLKL